MMQVDPELRQEVLEGIKGGGAKENQNAEKEDEFEDAQDADAAEDSQKSKGEKPEKPATTKKDFGGASFTNLLEEVKEEGGGSSSSSASAAATNSNGNTKARGRSLSAEEIKKVASAASSSEGASEGGEDAGPFYPMPGYYYVYPRQWVDNQLKTYVEGSMKIDSETKVSRNPPKPRPPYPSFKHYSYIACDAGSCGGHSVEGSTFRGEPKNKLPT